MNTPTESKYEYELKPRWIIRGTLTTTAAMHIGSGASELDENLAHDQKDPKSEQGTVSLVVRDHKGMPCVPGSAIKGVLRHYADTCGATAYAKSKGDKAIQMIFGEHGSKHADHHAGFVDFLPAFFVSAPQAKQNVHEGMPGYSQNKATGIIGASARERTTGAVAAQKLFHYEAVPDGTMFEVELDTEGLEADEVIILLNLMQGFTGKADSLSLGAKQAAGFGMMEWECKTVKCLTPKMARKWWGGINQGTVNSRWQDYAEDVSFGVDGSHRPVLNLPDGVRVGPCFSIKETIAIAATIQMDGPFLVGERVEKKRESDPDLYPRRTQDGKIELPGSSLHGALRSQSERICRTLGLEVPEGHLAPAYKEREKQKQDIVSWLFGAPGWRSALKVHSFTTTDSPALDALPVQDFVALDRFHGGVSGSAKFNVGHVLDPTLSGAMSVDMRRLKISGNHEAALGLLALTLRDLDEGDIPLGYGAAAKGYGQVDAAKTRTLKALEDELRKNHITVDSAVGAFRVYCKKALYKPVRPEPVEGPPCSGGEPASGSTGSPRTDGSSSGTVELPAKQTAPLVASSSAGVQLTVNPAAGHGDFHNPYAFLPVAVPTDKANWTNRAEFDQRNLGHHSHDRYALKDADGNPVYSGRIICRLKNNTPLAVGGKQTRNGNNPATVQPFKLGNDIALPATSLRGMIGSLIEAASQSSMRVLEDRQLSTRRLVNDAPLSAMGRVVEYNGELRLEPLCLPTLPNNSVPEEFRKMFPQNGRAPFKVLFADRRAPTPAENTFFSAHTSPSTAYYLNVPAATVDKNWQINFNGAALHRRGGQILGIQNPPANPPSAAPIPNGVSGIIRIMHCTERERGLPRLRKHEVWLPMTQEQMDLPVSFCDKDKSLTQEEINISNYYRNKIFPIATVAIERFEMLADERTESQDNDRGLPQEKILPYHPLGTQRNSKKVKTGRKTFKETGRALRIKPGDIVYFRPSDDGKSVAEIAFSSIWRSRIEQGNQSYGVHKFFRAIDPELLPFNSDREKISPAEWLLGFVSSGKKGGQEIDSKMSAFAGKMRFSFGLSAQPIQLLPEVPLKILASPKPPSPAMYFKPQNGSGYVSKPQLASNPGGYVPNGRKVYLHALRENGNLKGLSDNGAPETLNNGNEPWRSNGGNNNQKVQVAPIPKDSEFCFHIDFDNLDRSELELLCFALQPCEKYEHRLGMGRSLGLGSVSVIPEALLLVDRAARYGWDDFTKDVQRYHAVWQNSARPANSVVHGRYKEALEAASAAGYTTPASVSDLAKGGAVKVKGLSDALWRAIVLTGSPDAVKKPVHYPQLAERSIEAETYKWFVENDKPATTKQFVAPFADTSASIEPMKRHPSPPPK